VDNKKIRLKKTKKYGRGVFAKSIIRKGELIAAFDGPIISGDYEHWTEDLYRHAIQIGPNTWRDSNGLARFINHSCAPNCGIKRLTHVVAMQDIPKGEEITWDYEMTEKHPDWRMRCRCGAPLCRKIIGNYKNMPKDVRKRYKGYISGWLTGKNKKYP
jgi:SET domain-containing protein